MSEKETKSKEGTITVFNSSVQRFLIERNKTSQNHKYLEPGIAMEVPSELGLRLLKYKGVKDASKMVKTKSSEESDKTIKKLEAKIVELEARIKELLSDDKKKK